MRSKNQHDQNFESKLEESLENVKKYEKRYDEDYTTCMDYLEAHSSELERIHEVLFYYQMTAHSGNVYKQKQ